MFILNTFFALLWISLRKKYLWISFITLLIGWSFHGRFVQFSVNRAPLEDANEANLLHVMEYNMHGLVDVPPFSVSKFEEKKKNLSKYILEAFPQIDILCSLEGTAGLNIGLPHTIKAKKASIYTYSKYPIVAQGELQLPDQKYQFGIWADIKTPGGVIRVYNLHLQSNRITAETEELMDEIKVQERDTWIRIGDVISKYRRATAIRSDQARWVKKHVDNCPHPVLLCGDFNDTPQSNAYQTISKNLTDSFRSRGKGIGTTYAGSLPALRIDYIMLSSQLKVRQHEVLEWDYSDHFPILATLELNIE